MSMMPLSLLGSFLDAVETKVERAEGFFNEVHRVLRSGGRLSLLLLGVAQEFVRLEDRALTLVDEADPRTTTEMLSDWETTAGLPDPCHGLGATVEARRAELVARLTALGSCSRAFYIGIAATPISLVSHSTICRSSKLETALYSAN